MTFCDLTIYNDNPLLISLYTKPWPYYRTRPTEFWEVSIKEHLRRLWHADRGRLLLRNLVPSFGTCICSTCWDQPLFRTCHDFSDSALRTSLGTLSFCACHIRRYHNASNILFSLANQVRRFVHGAINSNASLSYEVSFRLRITDEGSVPEMRIWSILLI